MKADVRHQARDVLWQWTKLQMQAEMHDGDVAHRLQAVRLLYRLAHEEAHWGDMLGLLEQETHPTVQETLSWALYQTLTGTHEAPAVVDRHADRLARLLASGRTQAGGQGVRRSLLAFELVRKLLCSGDVLETTLQRLDPYMAGVVPTFPRKYEAIYMVARYILMRRRRIDRACLPPAEALLPCGGLGWVKALEYMAEFGLAVPRVECLAPLPSVFETRQLAGMLPTKAQALVARTVAAHGLGGGRPPLRLLCLLLHCNKARAGTLEAVPAVVDVVAAGVGGAAWDQAWRILVVVLEATREAALDTYLGQLPRLLQAAASQRSLESARNLLALLYKLAPSSVVQLVPDDLAPKLVAVLPPAMLSARFVDRLPCQGTPASCLPCVRLLCRLPAHAGEDLARRHARVVADAVGLEHQEDQGLRRDYLDLAGGLPDALFEACRPRLAAALRAGDPDAAYALLDAAPERLRGLQDAILARVLDDLDIWTEDMRPSVALALMTRLPHDVQADVAERLLFAGEPDAELPEARLYVLRAMPTDILARASRRVAAAFLKSPNPAVAQLAMEVLIIADAGHRAEPHAAWLVQAALEGPTRPYRGVAFRLLCRLPDQTLTRILVERPALLRQLGCRQAMLLLDRLDDVLLPIFADDILDFCEEFPHVEDAGLALARLPGEVLWRSRERVVAMMESGEHALWPGPRHSLGVLSDLGYQPAKDLLLERRYRDVLGLRR
jgi:hypothetical protein